MKNDRFSLTDLLLAYLYGVAQRQNEMELQEFLREQRHTFERRWVRHLLQQIGQVPPPQRELLRPCPQCGLPGCDEVHTWN